MNKIDLRDTRHKNLMRLIDDVYTGSQSEFAAAIRRNPTQVNHWVSRYRNPNGDTCRDVERNLGYQQGWLDQDHDISPTLAASLPAAPLQTEGAKQPPALTDKASAAINGVVSSTITFAERLAKSTPRRQAAVLSLLAEYAEKPKDKDRLSREIDMLLSQEDDGPAV